MNFLKTVMAVRWRRLLPLVWLTVSSFPVTGADTSNLGEHFDSEVTAIVNRYCVSCHSTEKKKGELDLERFISLENARNEPEIWKAVQEQIGLGEMPPAEKPQPSAEERDRLIAWIERLLSEVAEARAGDPGPVVLRRLNNAEYTFTLRDLTGVKSLNPAREFPGDSAAGEGFMNTGNSLVMSPSLLSKYLEAARKVTQHAILLPDGFRFSEKTTRRDWAEEILAEIRSFYARYTDAAGSEKVNLQGIAFDTNEGGRLPLLKYVETTLRYREELAKGETEFAKIARKHGLSPKYLRSFWAVMHRSDDSLLLETFRERWRTVRSEDATSLVKEIEQWQRALWKFSSVGHIGKVGGPKAWMEPVNPITNKQELRLKLPKATNSSELLLFLVASDAGDGSTNDIVVLERPRLVAKGQADIMLRDTDGLNREMFGKLPNGDAIDETSVAVQAPALLEIRLPAEIAGDAEFVTTGTLHREVGAEGSVQLQLRTKKPLASGGVTAGDVLEKESGGPWTSQRRDLIHNNPIVVNEGSAARKRIVSEFDDFRRWFPAALCYPKIVPVDEVVTLTLAHREDDQLVRLMLDEKEAARLNRLWEEYHFVSQNALLQVDAFEQLWQYATQDADPSVFEPMRNPIAARAQAFRDFQVKTEPAHVDALLEFASKAYRRPLTSDEKTGLRSLYENLRVDQMTHEEAFRHTLTRVFVSPSFLYRLEQSAPGKDAAPVSDWELATRLSYFVWSTLPDEELRAQAAQGNLKNPEVLISETRRMLRDPRVSRLATEFATAWLQIYDFESLDEKSERHFPEFAELREPMFQEAALFFTDLFQNDGSVLSIFDADHTFVNDALAKLYGIPGVTGAEWRRVTGVKKYARGSVLTMAATLAKQSGASRTSPILRGNWVSEVLLGEKLPRPPKGVPPLPGDEASEELTVRELVEKHTSDPSCANCHARIDGYGFALERFDAIGRARKTDMGGRKIETQSRLFDGTKVDGADDLRDYLLNVKRDALLQQFCRKLLGYSLGRTVQLSDRKLITEMRRALDQNDFKFSAAVETIVLSKQFREIRGKEQQATP